MSQFSKRICLAITGASGAPYGLRLLECLIAANCQIYLLTSNAGERVLEIEEGIKVPTEAKEKQAFFTQQYQAKPNQIQCFGRDDWMAAVASGSNAPDAMIVCPCSGGTLSAIACGASNNLIERAADVMIKERKQLIIVPREMPLSSIHLENMLKLSQIGVTVMPASPGFYHKPQSINDLIDFVVARILDHLKISQNMMPKWGA
ncbi:MAG: UbiX family flavin prenyltransferase [Gammaproteobacteria bacterium]|jgi:4-hydroxy-3-polyprenylbenzoate decarboxylase|nr:UbiX family flavin prenyltransferase [Gammaproteobacteria bacterium]